MRLIKILNNRKYELFFMKEKKASIFSHSLNKMAKTLQFLFWTNLFYSSRCLSSTPPTKHDPCFW